MEWHNWCQLCGKENGSEFNIFKNEGLVSIADIIKQFFSIEIINTEDSSKSICILCKDYLLSLNGYAKKVTRVHQLFIEIESNYQIGSDIDINEIRLKYDLELSVTSNDKKVLIKRNKQKNDLEIIEDNIKNKENDIINSNTKRKNINDTKKLRKNTENLFFNKENGFSESKRVHKKSQRIRKCHVLISNSIDNDSYPFIDKIKDNYSQKSCLNEDSLENGASDNKKPNSKVKKDKLFGENKRNDKTGDKNFECEECHQKFIRESNYLYHINNGHKVLPPCEFCGKICKTKQKLKLHLELHLPAEEREKLLHECAKCEKKFTLNYKLKEHVRAIHLQEKPFVCEQCGKNFATQSSLYVHKRTHDNQSRQKCNLCSKIFNNPQKLKYHMKHTHDSTGHPCSVCGQVLKTYRTLKNHMRIHSDTRPFKCNYCGKDFKRDYNLQIHMIRHSDLEPFACRFCNQSYANHSKCKKHEQKSHPAQYEAAAAIIDVEKQQELNRTKLPNIAQLETILEQLKEVGVEPKSRKTKSRNSKPQELQIPQSELVELEIVELELPEF